MVAYNNVERPRGENPEVESDVQVRTGPKSHLTDRCALFKKARLEFWASKSIFVLRYRLELILSPAGDSMGTWPSSSRMKSKSLIGTDTGFAPIPRKPPTSITTVALVLGPYR